MTTLAFTGTRRGLTTTQRAKLARVLADYPNATMHNGCAQGADEEALDLVRDGVLGPRPVVVLHPAELLRFIWAQTWTGTFQGLSEIRPVSAPLKRNRDMVDLSSVVVACPDGPEQRRGGTWSTIRHGRTKGLEVIVVRPDGTVTKEPARTIRLL